MENIASKALNAMRFDEGSGIKNVDYWRFIIIYRFLRIGNSVEIYFYKVLLWILFLLVFFYIDNISIDTTFIDTISTETISIDSISIDNISIDGLNK